MKDHFRTAGNVLYADVLSRPDGRSKGCGIVEFETAEQSLKAISLLSNSELDGRFINVREDREDPESAGTGQMLPPGSRGTKRAAAPMGTMGRRCYVGNLSWRTGWQDLKVGLFQ